MINLRSKIYSLHVTIYLPTTYQLWIIIKHLINFKGEINCVLSMPSWLFGIIFHFTNSLPINLMKVAIWYWNEGFYFLFHTKAGFSIFLNRVALHYYCNYWVNVLSSLKPGPAVMLINTKRNTTVEKLQGGSIIKVLHWSSKLYRFILVLYW